MSRKNKETEILFAEIFCLAKYVDKTIYRVVFGFRLLYQKFRYFAFFFQNKMIISFQFS